MKRHLAWMASALLLLAAVVLRYHDPGPLERLRFLVFDEYQRLAPTPYEDAGVRILDIDDKTLELVGQWPWPRTQMAALINKLGDMGVAAVALDIVFAEADRTSPNQVFPLWAQVNNMPQIMRMQGLRDHDAELAKAIKNVPTVLGMVLTETPGPKRPAIKWGMAEAGDDPRRFLLPYAGAVTNLSAIESDAGGQGSFNVLPESDGIVRRVPLLFALRGAEGERPQIYPSLVAETLRVAQGATSYVVKSSNANQQGGFGEQTGVNSVRIGRAIIPTDDKGRLWLIDTGPSPQRVVPVWRVLEPDSPINLKDTIVFIGTSAAGLRDLRATPLNLAAAGVDIHARIAEQIILDQFLTRPDWAYGAEIVFMCVLGIGLLYYLPRRGPVWCALVGVAGVAVGAGFSWLMFNYRGWLLDPVYPTAVALMMYLTQSLIVFLRTEAERRRIRHQFGTYLAPALVERLARNPDLLRLGGETRDMTIMFSDIRNFTTISEAMDASDLTAFINSFLTPMSDIVKQHRGYVDKYIGDAIMALWNAPVDDPDHARSAALAALAMIAELERLNAQWRAEAAAHDRPFTPIGIGIGLNTGPCCVGNLGSKERMNYSVIGDNVNLASRIEGQSKTYGVPIVVSEGTRARLDGFALVELDLLQVKGKERPVRVFALMGDPAAAAEGWFQALHQGHRAMLEAYRRRDWDRAGALLVQCRAAARGRLDTLYALYAERIAAYRLEPPPADWIGVTRALQK
jgi:adenylate cyclase